MNSTRLPSPLNSLWHLRLCRNKSSNSCLPQSVPLIRMPRLRRLSGLECKWPLCRTVSKRPGSPSLHLHHRHHLPRPLLLGLRLHLLIPSSIARMSLKLFVTIVVDAGIPTAIALPVKLLRPGTLSTLSRLALPCCRCLIRSSTINPCSPIQCQ